MESCLDDVEELLRECSQEWESEDVEKADEIVTRLFLLNDRLNTMLLYLQRNHSPQIDTFSRLISCCNLILLHWETKSARLSGQSIGMSNVPGRPRKFINIELVSEGQDREVGHYILYVFPQLEYLREMHLSWEQCAEVLFVSRSTLWRRLKGLGYIPHFSDIPDSELDAVVLRIQNDSPNNGAVMVWGQLRSYGICVPRRRVRESLMRVSPINVQLRATTAVVRRTYSVPFANALWHIDGLHCFIRWRIVIHGGIDGYSRKIVYLGASDNNRSDTVLKHFQSATLFYGWPLRVRSDYGGENVDVARCMINARGPGHQSHMAGASVHNQRIERLWRDTFRCVCHLYYSLFYEMETCDLLNPTDEIDIFCLHYVYIPRINFQLNTFMHTWNNHPMRTEHGMSPEELWSSGLTLADATVLDQPVSEDYGVEEGSLPIPFEEGSVTIPEVLTTLSDEQMNYLKSQHPPLMSSDYQGLDVYLAVREAVMNMLSVHI